MEGCHVFTAISGFGLRVIPRAPFVVLLGPNPGELDVQYRSPRGPRVARLNPGSGLYRTLIDQHTTSPHEVFAVEQGPD